MLKAALRDSLVYGLASILSKGLAIFLLPIYTRVLSPGDYGAYDLLITLGVLANLVVALEISQGLARHWADTVDREQKVRLASTTLWFTLLMYGSVLIVGLWRSPQFNRWLLADDDYLFAFQLGLGFIAVNGIFYLLLNQFRWELRSKDYAVVSFGYALLTLMFASAFCLWLEMGLEGVMLSQLLAVICASLFSWRLLRKSFGFRLDLNALRAMLAFSTPLVPAGLAVFISLYINRFALVRFATLEDVGLFGIGSRIAGLSSLFIVGIRGALTPLIYQNYRNPDTPAHIAKLFSWFLAIALLGCLFLTLFAKELLMVFATPEYLAGSILVIYLAPALLLSEMYIFAPGIAIQKKTHWQLWITLLAAAVSFVANWLTVPVWGITGAAISTLLSSFVFFAAWIKVSQWFYPVPYPWARICLAICGFVASAVAGIWLEELDLTVLLGVVAKSAVLACLLAVVVACRLFSITDLSKLLGYVQRRVSPGSPK